jgi:hypothetical protein
LETLVLLGVLVVEKIGGDGLVHLWDASVVVEESYNSVGYEDSVILNKRSFSENMEDY